MTENVKTATPDATFPAGGLLVGADSQASVNMSIYTAAAVKAGLGVGPAGSDLQLQYNASGVWAAMAGTSWDNTNRTLTIAGATLADGSQPILNLSQTWDNAATAFTAFKLNAITTNSAAASLLMDVQHNSVTQLKLDKLGVLTLPSSGGFFISNLGIRGVAATAALQLQNGATSLTSPAAARWQFGVSDAAAPGAQTIGPQSVVAGTSNTAGQPFKIRDSCGTGTGASGGVVIQTAPAGSTGTAQNAYVDALTIDSPGNIKLAKAFTVATLPAAGTVGRMARVTDGDAVIVWGATVVNSGAGATPYLVWDNGTNWTVVGK